MGIVATGPTDPNDTEVAGTLLNEFECCRYRSTNTEIAGIV